MAPTLITEIVLVAVPTALPAVLRLLIAIAAPRPRLCQILPLLCR